VEEQAIFPAGDGDDRDALPETIKALAICGADVAGAVRLYPLVAGGDEWKGDRLAVLPGFRHLGVAQQLVGFAVTTAGRLGGRQMVAHIQLPNVVFFERLGWIRLGDVETYAGLLHQPMLIDLACRGAK
jgi:putative N-acetyltransferase (TIGR04045 family)